MAKLWLIRELIDLKEYDYKKTAADISPEEKNKISHRAVAINRLKDDIKRFFEFER